jgi:hypothetical protein
MTRYILIDRHSGYIWGDSADLNGEEFVGSPVEFAAAVDASNGEAGRTYVEHRTTNVAGDGYFVYRADLGGRDVPVVRDGQDRETIDAVESHCRFVGFIERRGA